MIETLILTNLIPDRAKQLQHDKIIKQWIGNENTVTVIEFLTENLKGKYIQPDNAIQWLIDTINHNEKDIKLIDASRDHYWRDIIESETDKTINIHHRPYPDSIFQIASKPVD